jgi:hypothetical protein
MHRKILLPISVFVLSVFYASAHVDLTEEILRKIFPEAQAFAARQITLNSNQVEQLERATGSKINEHEREVVFYAAVGKNEAGGHQSMGAVFVVHGTGPQGIIDVAVGYDLDLKVKGIVILENKNDPKIEESEFLTQLTEKGPKHSLVLGEDVHFDGDNQAAEGLIRAVKTGMHLLRLVLKG